MTAHHPLRPNWACAGCGYPWPCASRRGQLLGEYADHPAALALVLSSAMVEAAADLRHWPAGHLHDRFVGWLPPYAPSPRHDPAPRGSHPDVAPTTAPPAAHA